MLYFLRVAMSHQYVLHFSAWKYSSNIEYRLRNRDKLLQYNTVADAVQLIRRSERILILTGAGISEISIYSLIILTHPD